MKEFSELIKNIDMLRRLIREFFVFGYKTRTDFDRKSSKTFDNDKRRIQNYFEEYFYGARDKNGKRNAILIDSDRAGANPLYRLYKSKSFKFIALRSFWVQVIGGTIAIIAAICGAGLYALIINPIFSSILLFIISYRKYPLQLKITWGMTSMKKYSNFQPINSCSIS